MHGYKPPKTLGDFFTNLSHYINTGPSPLPPLNTTNLGFRGLEARPRGPKPLSMTLLTNNILVSTGSAKSISVGINWKIYFSRL
jgi:hypothetical protein